MKKNYIKPLVLQVAVNMQPMLQTSPFTPDGYVNGQIGARRRSVEYYDEELEIE